MDESSFEHLEGEEDSYKPVETDPTSRFVRLPEAIQLTEFKEVYRAIDTDKGIEVAWNKIPINKLDLDQDQLLKEIEIFKNIRHNNIIELYEFWIEEGKQVVFITELLPSGTLFTYLEKSMNIRLRIIKSWCKQILSGLKYLHERNPPIIHRDIKCSNIYINGITNDGGVKIGDIGLRIFSRSTDSLSKIETPHFMAPEYYSNSYSIGVDIWAFGMLMLEMITRTKPYCECSNFGRIVTKVTEGILPIQYDAILDPNVKNFIGLCFKPENERPSASELLNNSFFINESDLDNQVVSIDENIMLKLWEHEDSTEDINITLPNIGVGIPLKSKENQCINNDINNSHNEESNDGETNCNIEVVTLNTVNEDPNSISLKLQIETEEEKIEIDFDYNIENDKASVVANEMCEEMKLDKSALKEIQNLIQEQVHMIAGSDQEENSPIISHIHSPIHSISIPTPNDISSSSHALDSSDDNTGSFLAMNPEFLADKPINSPHFTEPPQSINDTSYLEEMEALIDSSDDENNASNDNLINDGMFDLDDSYEDNENKEMNDEITELIAKHLEAQNELIKKQKKELKDLEEKQKQRRLARRSLIK